MQKPMWSLYIRLNKVFVPSKFKTEAGFYIDADPVHVADLSSQDDLRDGIASTLNRGCPLIPTPPVSQLKRWVVLRASGVRSVAVFEKDASCWLIIKDDKAFSFGPVARNTSRGWYTNIENAYLLSKDASIDIVADEVSNRIVQLCL